MEGSLRACAGACAVVDEFLALVEDFKQEVRNSVVCSAAV